MQAHIYTRRCSAAVKSDLCEEFSIRSEGMCLTMSNKNWYIHLIANK